MERSDRGEKCQVRAPDTTQGMDKARAENIQPLRLPDLVMCPQCEVVMPVGGCRKITCPDCGNLVVVQPVNAKEIKAYA